MQKIKPKTIIASIKIFILLLNILVLFFLFSFYKKYVYESIVVDEDYIAEQSLQKSNDINIEQFNLTLNKLIEQKRIKNNNNIKNFFEVK